MGGAWRAGLRIYRRRLEWRTPNAWPGFLMSVAEGAPGFAVGGRALCFRILQLGPVRLEPGPPKFGFPPNVSWAPFLALWPFLLRWFRFFVFLGVGFGFGVSAVVGDWC